MKVKLFLIAYLVLIFSCSFKGSSSKNSIIGMWFGGGYQLDKDYYRPVSNILYFKEGNVLLSKAIGKRIDTLAYEYNDDLNLYINNNNLVDFQIQDNNTLLQFRYQHLNTFRKAMPTISHKSQIEIYDLLTNKYWKNKGEMLFYESENNTLKKNNLNQDGYLQYCFSLDSIENVFFLFKYGNQKDCSKNNQYIEQLINISEQQYEVIRWEDNGFKKIKYTAVNKANFIKDEPTNFQLCDEYLNVNYPNHRYYAVGTNYKGGIYQIKKIFKTKYIAPKKKENGLIRIRFIVNCEGKAGMFEILELDKNYKKKKLNKKITLQILSIVKKLNGWIAGEKNSNSVDSYKFLTFKIQDSEIVEIFP